MMMKDELPGGSTNSWARVCDTCCSAPCTVYCKADSAYLCTTCDEHIHAANLVASRHERVWVCEACERAPAAFLCKADAASLCVTCDADIHSANPLARRHQRVPIMPVAGCGYSPPGEQMSKDVFMCLTEGDGQATDLEADENEAVSWLLLNTGKNSTNQITNGFVSGTGEIEEYLNLLEYNSGGDNQLCEQYNQQQEFSVPEKHCGGDSVVPEAKDHHQIQYPNFLFGMECDTKSGFNYNTCHNVSVSSMDVGVVPDFSMSDISVSHPAPLKGTIDLFSSHPMQVPTQLSPLDREARVLRYREKKKNRKFEKTIRYASRKAYAETRPRIKGRFAKRTDVELEMEQMFTNSFMSDSGYGIVPSF